MLVLVLSRRGVVVAEAGLPPSYRLAGIFTDRFSGAGTAFGRVRPLVCLLNQLTLSVFLASVRGMSTACLGLRVEVKVRVS